MNTAQFEAIDAEMELICQPKEGDSNVIGNGKCTYKHTCEMCSDAEGIYKCPACNMFTCSLKCCLEHKSEVNQLYIQ